MWTHTAALDSTGQPVRGLSQKTAKMLPWKHACITGPLNYVVNFLTAFCLHSPVKEREHRIWSSFIWNSSLFPSMGSVPEIWGMAQNPSIRECGKEPEGSHESEGSRFTECKGLFLMQSANPGHLWYITQTVKHTAASESLKHLRKAPNLSI